MINLGLDHHKCNIEYLNIVCSLSFVIHSGLTASSTDTDDFIKGRAVDGLEYLNMRADFWRQQKPMYARQRDRKRQKQQNAHSSDEENQPMQYILQKLEEIDEGNTFYQALISTISFFCSSIII